MLVLISTMVLTELWDYCYMRYDQALSKATPPKHQLLNNDNNNNNKIYAPIPIQLQLFDKKSRSNTDGLQDSVKLE
ncbi:unnamed protein product [Angiostrongylus costaricensis]|uniref:Neur_chan_memb domain-containing protein n=1 Tax=Angiostrongylus costaricensis TaxID=334426 RepID=A0A0R3PYW6_ANGCS|nr:unnamed protein product [Angiostrongylus costaricensis]